MAGCKGWILESWVLGGTCIGWVGVVGHSCSPSDPSSLASEKYPCFVHYLNDLLYRIREMRFLVYVYLHRRLQAPFLLLIAGYSNPLETRYLRQLTKIPWPLPIPSKTGVSPQPRVSPPSELLKSKAPKAAARARICGRFKGGEEGNTRFAM